MIGQTFAPLPTGDPNDEIRRRQGAGGPLNNVGQAIRTLSLRIPRVVGAGSIAPSQLLNSPGSGGLPQSGINPVIDAILRGVLGNYTPPQQTAPSAPGGQTYPNIPPPQIIPGLDDSRSGGREISGSYTPPPQTEPTFDDRLDRETRQQQRGKGGIDTFVNRY